MLEALAQGLSYSAQILYNFVLNSVLCQCRSASVPHNPRLIPAPCASRRITPLLRCSAGRRLNGRVGATVTARLCAGRSPTTQDCKTLPSINPCVYIWKSCRMGHLPAQHTHQPSGFCVVCLTSSSRSAAKPPSIRHACRAQKRVTGLPWAASHPSPAAAARSGCRGCRWPWPSPRPGGRRAGACSTKRPSARSRSAWA